MFWKLCVLSREARIKNVEFYLYAEPHSCSSPQVCLEKIHNQFILFLKLCTDVEVPERIAITGITKKNLFQAVNTILFVSHLNTL